jgi:spermidine synthase
LIKVNQIQKFGSFFIPVKVWKGSSPVNPVLELFLFRGEWQLGTTEALYSSGTNYRPLVVGFDAIKEHLNRVKTVLVLGAGLGSAAAILFKMGYQPLTTLVDLDPVVIDWAKELMIPYLRDKVTYSVENAQTFIEANLQKFDLLVIDIFSSRQVPDFVSNLSFLSACRSALTYEGHIIANYMINSDEDWNVFLRNFMSIFPHARVTELGMNRVLIAKV